MEKKITALSDEEMMDVTGGWLIMGAPNVSCSNNTTKDSCQKAKCSWNSSTDKCS